MSASEHLLFTTISVFARGGTFETVEAICNPDGALELLEELTSLVDKSLVRQEWEQAPRFPLLETILLYAVGDLASWRRRAAGHGAPHALEE